jgi:uncharacterized phage protein (TIGR01671 family)
LNDGNYCIYEFGKTELYAPIIDSKSICQFTGMVDKNGTNIFDGDMVKSDKMFYSTHFAVVQWLGKRCGFFYVADAVGTDIINRNPFKSAYKMNSLKVEIIGNINDNLNETK